MSPKHQPTQHRREKGGYLTVRRGRPPRQPHGRNPESRGRRPHGTRDGEQGRGHMRMRRRGTHPVATRFTTALTL